MSVQRSAADKIRKRLLMDENNQILDVTYGNFSCRLEGFEDSVETMKTVVAYFHELAGHARFMDVDPQAPDMAALALLTQEQTGMPVDVSGDGNNVSLRAAQEPVEEDFTDDLAALDGVTTEEIFADDAPTAEVEAAAEDIDVDDTAIDEAATDDASTEDFDVDASVADKLQRIRAVVDGDPETDDDYAEDLSDDATAAPAANPLTQRLAELAARKSEESDLTFEDDADATPEVEDDLQSLRNVFDEAPIAADEDTAAKDDLDAIADDIADEVMDDGVATETPDDDVTAQAEDDDLAAAWDEIDAEGEVSEELDATLNADLEDDATDIPKTDDAAEITAEDDEETDGAEAERAKYRSPLVLTAREAVTPDNVLTDDDDFNLQEEVAKVEAEIAARQGNEVARHGLPRSVEDAMSRIMSQTDQHLNQPESRRHRDAFAQLKAAVAATEAARQLGDAGGSDRDPDADFKDDLGAHDAEEKDQAQAAAPLKLVKSEMITPENTLKRPKEDVGVEPIKAKKPVSSATKTRIIGAVEAQVDEQVEKAPKSSKPMDAASERLRQIAALKETEGAVKRNGFAEFAAAHGATELVDKLEAAGAYICFVEGNEDFSRPQVMKVVQSASDAEITREDGLRCFGRLLRQARLVKLSNGRFQVTENTQYRPDGNKAAQG